MMKKIITVPKRLLSLNEIITLHWAVRIRMKQIWKDALWFGSMNLAKNSYSDGIRYLWEIPDKRKYKVTITRFAPRMLDFDNFVGGCKFLILDNIKSVKRKKIGHKMVIYLDNGLIYDDSPEYLNVKYKQIKSKEYKTIIEVI